MLEEGYIALLDNGWTDNELCIKWLKKCFNLATIYTKNQYWILLIDGYHSHIINAALRFYIDSKIILLYLPSYTIYVL
jgi:DDE superfamily endonuclease